MAHLMLNDALRDGRYCIVDTDHPLSIGYRTYLWCDHPQINCAPTEADMQYLLNGVNSAGMHAVWHKHRIMGVAIRAREDGRVVPMGRIIELIVHEVSHLVDGMFERAAVSNVDTELRAYYLDWIVGKALHRFGMLWDNPT